VTGHLKELISNRPRLKRQSFFLVLERR
jgi:hypothetical protein